NPLGRRPRGHPVGRVAQPGVDPVTFANPWWFLLLGLPPVMVLLHARRRRTVEVSSTCLWRRLAATAERRAARTRPPLDPRLLLHLLALLLLAGALARPQLAGAGGSAEHWVVLVDASAAMQAPSGRGALSRSGAARELVASRLEEQPEARLSLLQVGARPRVVAARSADRARVGAELGSLRGTHEPADWEAAARLARGLVREGEDVLFTVVSDERGVADATAALGRSHPG